jgi:hypothetical protein
MISTVVLGFLGVGMFGLTGLVIHLLIEVKAMQRSTHKIQFVNPLAEEFEQMTEETKTRLTEDPFKNIQ